MEFDTIYYFNYNASDDSSSYKTSIPVKDIIGVSIMQSDSLKDGYNFKIDLGQKVYLLNSKYVTIVNEWVTAIEMAKNYTEEAERTKYGQIRVNANYIKTLFDEEVALLVRPLPTEEVLLVGNRESRV